MKLKELKETISDPQRNQYEHEIKWLKNEIYKLEKSLPKKPSKQKQIDNYKHQIKQKELLLTFDKLEEKERTFDEWVELTVLAAGQNEGKPIFFNDDDDTELILTNLAKKKAREVGVPEELVNKVAYAAADKIDV